MGKKTVRILLLTLAVSCLLGSIAYAAEGLDPEVKKFIGLAAGIGLGIAAMGGGL
jgi:hypothetical protein